MSKIQLSFRVTEDGQLHLKSDRLELDPLSLTSSRDLAIQILTQQAIQGVAAARDMLARSSVVASGDPMLCDHANECPRVCSCGAGCYCKTRTCAP